MVVKLICQSMINKYKLYSWINKMGICESCLKPKKDLSNEIELEVKNSAALKTQGRLVIDHKPNNPQEVKLPQDQYRPPSNFRQQAPLQPPPPNAQTSKLSYLNTNKSTISNPIVNQHSQFNQNVHRSALPKQNVPASTVNLNINYQNPQSEIRRVPDNPILFPNSQISNQSRSGISGYQQPPPKLDQPPRPPQPSKQLIEKQKHFLSGQTYKKTLRTQCQIQEMIQVAAEAHNLQLFTQQIDICKRALDKVQSLEKRYSEESISLIKSYIYAQLTNAAIADNKEKEADQYFAKAIQFYNNTVQSATIEERITLLNNYSVFKNKLNKNSQAKKYLKLAIELMTTYYVVVDDRKYLSLVNLACLEYESKNWAQADQILQKIMKECKNKEIIQLAKRNQMHYKGR